MGIYISRLKLRSFKSFKFADIEFGSGFCCLAGPNGSGKSNICDAIRFSLGEMSLKSLRVKKVHDLIHHNSSKAEVTLDFAGDEKVEARRGIRDDGKVLYRLNGKRATRTALLEALSPYGFESSTHNIIAQGQIQHIVEMNSKQRREILDSVSGVMEFEHKKEEALTELEKVEAKINDTKIVLAEREGFLSELEKEKNDTLSYLEASGTLKRSKATLVGIELDKLEAEHTKVLQESQKATAAKKEADEKIAELDSKIKKLTEEKDQFIQKINKRSEREGAIKEIEGLKSKVGAANAAISEKKTAIKKIEAELEGIARQKKELASKVTELEKKIQSSQKEAKQKEKELSELKAKLGVTEENEGSKTAVEKASESLSLLLQNKAKLEAELASTTQLLEFRKEEKKRIDESPKQASDTTKLESQKKSCKSSLASIEREIERLFEEEKKLNREIPEMDKQRLELAEKAANLRANVRGGGERSQASALIEQMKGKIPGIYGTVSDIVSFDTEYAVAVEASCAQRLYYVVVENVDVASQVIAILKKQKAGRCTFIPLDRKLGSTTPEIEKIATSPNSLGFISEFVKYDRKFEPAMNYVFSDTILVNSIEDAKKIGLQKARMVSMQGDLLERSGIITGGNFTQLSGARSQLEKVEAEVVKIKEKRESLYSSLYSLRDEMGKKRKEKAEIEIEMKGIEVKLEGVTELEKGASQAKKASEEIDKSLEELASLLEKKKSELSSAKEKVEKAQADLESLRQKVTEEEKKLQAAKAGEQKKLHEFVASHSSLIEAIKGLENEAGLHRQTLLSSLEAEKKANVESDFQKSEISKLEKECAASEKTILAKEEELKEASKQVQKWFDAAKKLEEEMAVHGVEKGKHQHLSETTGKKLEDFRVKQATTETKLVDLKAEYEEYKTLERIEASREKLLELIRESESLLGRLGNVNLKAPELYEEKKKDISEIRVKITKLSDERAAVLQMITEIEKRKHAVFMETYNAIADNFKKLYSTTFKEGDAMLVLENPSDPFSGGLSIKVRSGNHDKHIESMSGGEKSLMAIVFVFAIQLYKPAPFYVLDEVDAALDKENSKKLSGLVASMAKKTQFIVVTHNDAMLTAAETAIGVTMTEDGSKVIGIQLKNIVHAKNPLNSPAKEAKK